MFHHDNPIKSRVFYGVSPYFSYFFHIVFDVFHLFLPVFLSPSAPQIGGGLARHVYQLLESQAEVRPVEGWGRLGGAVFWRKKRGKTVEIRVFWRKKLGKTMVLACFLEEKTWKKRENKGFSMVKLWY